jgi:hypothetical protein
MPVIVGRTPEGRIKTLTDGGLRAVNCACCDACPCAVTIPQALRELVANATIDTVTILGYSADFFIPDYQVSLGVDAWYATFLNDPSEVDFFAELIYNRTTGCLVSGYFSYGGNGFGSFGDGQVCEDQEDTPTQNGTFTINGEGEFLYYYATGLDPSGDPYNAVPPPNLVFT